MTRATEDRFVGAMLGLAIGDALGMPFAGMDRAAIAASAGPVREYHSLVDAPAGDVAAGEVTDETETVLSLAEVLTTTGGMLDADLAGPRLAHLARSESRRWFPDSTLAGIFSAEQSHEYMMPLDEDAPMTPDLMVRGVPIGLVQSVGVLDLGDLMADAETAVRLTHGSTAAITAVTAVALVTRYAVNDEHAPARWAGAAAELIGGDVAGHLAGYSELSPDVPLLDLLDQISEEGRESGPLLMGIAAASRSERFEDAVFAAVEAGGATDSTGALAGAFAGARFGSSGIPQRLIDELGCRIYVSLAAPWLLKAARRRAGSVIDLLPRFDLPRPDMPPRV
jgi:ADP-ribosylglycohydrolase